MYVPHPLGHWSRHHRPNQRGGESAVERKIVLGNSCRGRKPPLVRRIIAAECSNIVQSPPLASHDPIARNEIGAYGGSRLRLEHGFIKARRQRINEVNVAGKFSMLFPRHAARDKYSKMADRFVDRVHDCLTVFDDVLDIIIDVKNPAKCLLGWRYVIAPRAKDYDRRADVA